MSGDFLIGFDKGILLAAGCLYWFWMAWAGGSWLEKRGWPVKKGWKKGIFAAVCLAGAGVLLWSLKPGTSWIPSSWSDFSYWGDLIREQKENFTGFYRQKSRSGKWNGFGNSHRIPCLSCCPCSAPGQADGPGVICADVFFSFLRLRKHLQSSPAKRRTTMMPKKMPMLSMPTSRREGPLPSTKD